MNDFSYLIRIIKHGLRNLREYFNLIWNDSDYDQVYFYKMLRFKFDRIRNTLDNTFEGSDEVCENISKAISALDRLIEDDYCSEEYDAHFEKYGNLDLKFNDDGTCSIEYGKEISKEDEEIRHTESLDIERTAEERRQMDIDIICEIIRSDVQKWWI